MPRTRPQTFPLLPPCPTCPAPQRYEPQQLVKGMYAEFVEAWAAVFPREQLLFLRTEDYKAAPRVRRRRGRGGG